VLEGITKYVKGLMTWQRSLIAAMVSVSFWTLFYFFALRLPVPTGWSIRRAESTMLILAAIGGALSRCISRKASPIVLGAAAGIVVGGSQAYVSDVSTSFWQRVAGGLVTTPFTVLLLVAIASGWALAHACVRRWRAWRDSRTMERA
jgi:hypothetical protein